MSNPPTTSVKEQNEAKSDESGFQGYVKRKGNPKFAKTENNVHTLQEYKGKQNKQRSPNASFQRKFVESPDNVVFRKDFIKGTELDNSLLKLYGESKQKVMNDFIQCFEKELSGPPITISKEFVFEFRDSFEHQKRMSAERQKTISVESN